MEAINAAFQIKLPRIVSVFKKNIEMQKKNTHVFICMRQFLLAPYQF